MYLQNVWYAAAFANEVGNSPLARKLLDSDWVLYRKASGDAVMLRDRCPHRGAPLSLGTVMSDELHCPYHGLRFNSAGRCTNLSTADAECAKGASSVVSVPVLEKYGLIWFWAGAPELVDEKLIPEIAFLNAADRFGLVTGYVHVAGNYQLVVDNLLDLSHAQYIHPEFAVKGVDAEKALAHTTVRLERRERSLFNYRVRSGLPAPTASRKLFGMDEKTLVHVKTHMTWHPPAILDFDAGSWAMDTPEEEGAHIPQLHVITPETEFTSHYFFINGRNRRLGDPEVDAALLKVFDTAFRGQDEPMIAAVQQRMGHVSDIEVLQPALLQIDAAPMAARRLLSRLIAEERAGLSQGSEGRGTHAG